MRDQAGALVGAGGTAIRVGRDGQDHQPTICHGFELASKEERLLSRLPGVGHPFGRGLAVARDRVPAEVDARRDHQTIIGKVRAVGEANPPRLWIDARGRSLYHLDALGAYRLVAEALVPDVTEAGKDRIAEGTRREGGVRLEEDDFEAGVEPAQEARARGSGESSSHHDDVGGSLGARLPRQERRGDRRGGETQEATPRASHRAYPTAGC